LIFFDIKQINLINLTGNQLNIITAEFIKTESFFKNGLIKRKNMISYYSLIYLTMKRLGYPDYDNILLPNNFKAMKLKYDNHLFVT